MVGEVTALLSSLPLWEPTIPAVEQAAGCSQLCSAALPGRDEGGVIIGGLRTVTSSTAAGVSHDRRLSTAQTWSSDLPQSSSTKLI